MSFLRLLPRHRAAQRTLSSCALATSRYMRFKNTAAPLRSILTVGNTPMKSDGAGVGSYSHFLSSSSSSPSSSRSYFASPLHASHSISTSNNETKRNSISESCISSTVLASITSTLSNASSPSSLFSGSIFTWNDDDDGV